MESGTINKLITKVHQNAVEHGFWEETKSDDHCLCLVVSELMEAVEADRCNKHADLAKFNSRMDDYLSDLPNKVFYEDYFKICFRDYIKDSVEDELADALIRLLDFTGSNNCHLYNVEELIKGSLNNKSYIDSLNNKSFTELMWVLVRALACKPSHVYGIQCIIIDLFCISKILNIDLLEHVKMKMAYNSFREYKHGKKY